ncbi:protein THEM6-like [Cydia pomonella]|uniref:protein THEM6-like n=1 Tax=Cydia pomonella TaxID=82600 RepID=UPI002ADE3EC3|nr:protein THEM6-like [Cydia pomonella]XP_061728617.1 protein THEM6-like [Cydia pomonella]
MWFLCLLYIFFMVVCDANYFIRAYFTVIGSRLFNSKISIKDTATIYGICTLQDCDITFTSIRLARLVRDLDFARYQFYDRTGIYQRSRQLRIKSLQGCTLTVTSQPVPLFQIYKIDTKLVYWDDRSLFFEHKVITTGDGKVRSFLVSRQHAIGEKGHSTEALLEGLRESEARPTCPDYIQLWLKSMETSSKKLRAY